MQFNYFQVYYSYKLIKKPETQGDIENYLDKIKYGQNMIFFVECFLI